MSSPAFPGLIRMPNFFRAREKSCTSLLLYRSFFDGKCIAQCTKMALGNEGKLRCVKPLQGRFHAALGSVLYCKDEAFSPTHRSSL